MTLVGNISTTQVRYSKQDEKDECGHEADKVDMYSGKGQRESYFNVLFMQYNHISFALCVVTLTLSFLFYPLFSDMTTKTNEQEQKDKHELKKDIGEEWMVECLHMTERLTAGITDLQELYGQICRMQTAIKKK